MKVKNILNNIGAISKQAIVGSVICVATVAVGIGLVNNFSKSGSSEQGFASNALESSGYTSTYTGASTEDILSAREYAQTGGKEGTVSAITGTENLALSKNNSPAGIQQGQGAVAAEGSEEGSITDDSQSYGSGELEGMGTSKKIAVDVNLEDEAAAKAQKEAKIAEGKALGDKAKASLRTSKMADGSGIKGIETGSTSMSYGNLGSNAGAGSASGAAGDSSKIALSQAQLSNVNLQAAKAGKLGGMGSKGVEAEGTRIGRASAGQNYQSLGDLGRASKYSMSAKKAVTSDRALGAADAAAAFDGSKEAEAVSLDGENIQQAALNNLKDMGAPEMQNDFSKLKTDIDTVDANMKKWERLMDQYAMCIQAMILILSVASVAIAIASKLPMPPGAILYAVVLLIATAGLLAAAIASNVFLGQIADLAKETGYTESPAGWDWAAPWLLFAGSVGLLIGSGFIPLGSQAAPYLFGMLGSLGSGGIISSIKKMISLGKNIKATKEAEEAAKKIESETNK